MDNKANAYLHECLTWLTDDCLSVTGRYDEERRFHYPKKAKETAMLNIEEDIEDIEKALEVFQNAEMMAIEECGVARSAASRMRREAKRNLIEHMKAKGEWE